MHTPDTTNITERSPAGGEPSHRDRSTGTPDRKTILFLLVTAFLNTMGIGIINPVLPFIAQQYVGNPQNLATVVGWLASVYAICQFLAAPMLGALSDRFGRRPLLLICLLGSAIGYLLFGLGGALWALFLGRMIDGLTGGNFSILFAYVADISQPEERGKYFGLAGAVAGAGFIVGPALGGLASKLGYQAPVYIAAAITLINIAWGFFNLPESLSKEHRAGNIRLSQLNPFQQLRRVFAMPQLRWLLLAIFFFGVPFAVLQTNSVVLIKDSLGWQADSVSLIFLLVGITDIIMQGGLAGRLLPVFGEVKLTMGGLVCEMIAYLLISAIAFVASPIPLLVGTVVFAIGTGLIEPALNGLVSRVAGPRQQGAVQGGSQSIQSLALILGPLWGGMLYTRAGHAWPYWSAAVFVVLAILAVLLAIPSIRTQVNISTKEMRSSK